MQSIDQFIKHSDVCLQKELLQRHSGRGLGLRLSLAHYSTAHTALGLFSFCIQRKRSQFNNNIGVLFLSLPLLWHSLDTIRISKFLLELRLDLVVINFVSVRSCICIGNGWHVYRTALLRGETGVTTYLHMSSTYTEYALYYEQGQCAVVYNYVEVPIIYSRSHNV